MTNIPPPNMPPQNDSYARGSFTFRRMRPWQVWALVLAVILIAFLIIFAWAS